MICGRVTVASRDSVVTDHCAFIIARIYEYYNLFLDNTQNQVLGFMLKPFR